MRYTRNLEALLFGQKLNTYQMSLAIQEYEYLKTELSKYQHSDIKQGVEGALEEAGKYVREPKCVREGNVKPICTCIGEHKTYELDLNEWNVEFVKIQ